jgi:type IV pilus assembly protein PilE
VIGILAAIAYPSFRDAVLKARRADALDAITSIRLAQEKFRANCIQYATELDPASASDTCVTPPDTPEYKVIHPTTSNEGHYSPLAIEEITGRPYSVAYKITATAQGDQINDSCGDFILEVDSGAVEKYTDEYAAGSAEARRCWRR